MPSYSTFESWGRFPRQSHAGELVPYRTGDIKELMHSVAQSILPRGLGRSYGDSCLNENGYLLSTRRLDKFYDFDPETGYLTCESGVTLDQILQVFVPKGWFLPVTPGTKFVTVGGAIANDIHGKNHHKAGSIGNHINHFEILRSDGVRLVCSRDENPEWFRATIGGLGLTGVILWAELRLKPVAGPYIDMESVRFKGLDEFFALSEESEQDYEYTVSWLDCLYNGEGGTGRGIFMRGNHSDIKENNASKVVHNNSSWKTFPFDAPAFLLSAPTIRLFNFLYYNKQRDKSRKTTVHYDQYFFPLDSINHWNRMYGKRGFLQWQFVAPVTEKNEAVKKIFSMITKSRLGSFLVVIKVFGRFKPAGMLSFPRPGVTLTLDFANVGPRLFSLLDELDKIVTDAGGGFYPAKDARMSGRTFRASFPQFEEFRKYTDPKLSSSFYRRVEKI